MTLPSAQGSVQPKQRTRSSLSAGLEKNLSSYAIAAGSAGVALLACVQPADAKVVATKTDIVVPVNGGVIQFDINGDGQADFGLSAIGNLSTTCTLQARVRRPKSPPPLGCPFNDQLKVVPAQAANEVWQAGTSYGAKCAANLAGGARIGFGRPFGTGVMDMYGDVGTSEGHQFCPWRSGAHPYLGVKFLDAAGAVHYGWVRVQVNFIRATIEGYAYETVPNRPIHAGALNGTDSKADMVTPPDLLTPHAAEPASLGRLAQGASGLSVWRREDEVVAA
jgi:hypothetical protein